MSRHPILILGCAGLLTIVPVHAADQFPYEGTVSVNGGSLFVRAGPSDAYYRTGVLNRGDRVTVVGEAAEGWLAIEPPAGSFSWISGEYVREIAAAAGEVTGENVLVRIGTPLDDRLREYTQIKLKRGDRVRILERKTFGEGPLAKTWLKIEPPPGEVRYVSGRYVNRPDGRPAFFDSADPAVPSRGTGRDPLGAAGHDDDRAGRGRDNPSPDGEEQGKSGESSARLPDDPVERADAVYRAEMRKPLAQRALDRVRSLYQQAAPAARDARDRYLISRRLEEIDDQAERQAKWRELEQIFRRSKERDRMLGTFAQPAADSLSEIGDDSSMTADDRAPDETASGREPDEPPQPQARQPQTDQTALSPKQPFDASGVLRRADMNINGRPAYTLVSPQGGIRCYVTPAAGVNISAHLNKTVAVRGDRDGRSTFPAPHLIVRDIRPIDLPR